MHLNSAESVRQLPFLVDQPWLTEPGHLGQVQSFQLEFGREELGLSWNKASVHVKIASEWLASLLVEIGAGGELKLQNPDFNGVLLYVGLQGKVNVQGADETTEILPGEMELGLAIAQQAFRTSLGARGILVAVSEKQLHLMKQIPIPNQVNPSQLLHRLKLGSKNGSTWARLLHDCIAGLSTRDVSSRATPQVDRVGVLIGLLLNEAVDEVLAAEPCIKDESAPWYIAAAEERTLEANSEPVSLVDLARAAGISRKKLHNDFRKHRGTSPMKLLRLQRLQMVWRELSEPDRNTNVTDSALKWGFNHLGRFSGYYAANFGEKPSDTLRLSRARQESSEAAKGSARRRLMPLGHLNTINSPIASQA